MTAATHCETCGYAIPANAPGGICPACLLRQGLSHRPDGDAFSDGRLAATAAGGSQVSAPTPAELAPAFPMIEIRELIGQGGMGAVYLARQTKLDRDVALKIIRPESASDAAFAERFSREARTLARLSHPNIIGVHDFGEFESGYFFLMEYVDGANLRQLMDAERLEPAQALSIVRQICDALQYAHDVGVVHRDIKPENILVDQRGHVKIADFGLARLAAGEHDDAANYFTLTGTHQVMGTPRYMAPEQLEASRCVDHRADIYSLGVVFYEMLTGEVPMGSFVPPSHKSGIDSRLDEVVLRAMAREPDRRYQRASMLAMDVESISGIGTARNGGYVPFTARSADSAAGPGRAGMSTIFEREAEAAFRWFAGAPAESQSQFRVPTLLMLLISVVGCLCLFLPWLDITVEIPVASLPSTEETTTKYTLAVFQDAPAESTQPDRRRHHNQSQVFLADQELRVTLIGLSCWPGIAAASCFALLSLLLIAVPMRERIPVVMAVLLLAISIVALTMSTSFRSDAVANGWQYQYEELLNRQPAFLPAERPSTANLPPDGFALCVFQEEVSDGPADAFAITGMSALNPVTEFRYGFFASLVCAMSMILMSALGIRHAVLHSSAPQTSSAFASGSQAASAETPLAGGRDWVTLTKEQVDNELLPDACMVCGIHTKQRVNRTFQWAPDWAGLLTMAGGIPGFVALAITTRQFRLPCPVCEKHRHHWSRFVWVCSTGWIVPVVLAGAGVLIGRAFIGPNRSSGQDTAMVIGGLIGGLVPLAAWIITMIRMGVTRVSVTRITKDSITFSRVSAAFAKAAEKLSDRARESGSGMRP